MQDVSEALPRFRLQDLRQYPWRTIPRAAQVWAIPALKGGNRAFCDRMNSWGRKAKDCWACPLHLLGASEESGAGPLAKNIGPQRTKADCRSAQTRRRRCLFLRCRQAEGFRDNFAGPRAHEGRGRTSTSSPKADSSLSGLDRRFHDVRMERRRKEDRFFRTTRSRCRTCRSRNLLSRST